MSTTDLEFLSPLIPWLLLPNYYGEMTMGKFGWNLEGEKLSAGKIITTAYKLETTSK